MILDLTRFSFPFLSTGFFFLLSWSLFTYHHREEISQDLSSLGSSYWFGAIGWFLLLVVEMIVFVAEQAVVPDILPDLEKAVESWRISSQPRAPTLSCSDSSYCAYSPSDMYPQRFVSAAPWVKCIRKKKTKGHDCECVRYTLMRTGSTRNRQSLAALQIHTTRLHIDSLCLE